MVGCLVVSTVPKKKNGGTVELPKGQYNTTKSPKQKQNIMQLENFKNLTQLIFPIILTQHQTKHA